MTETLTDRQRLLRSYKAVSADLESDDITNEEAALLVSKKMFIGDQMDKCDESGKFVG